MKLQSGYNIIQIELPSGIFWPVEDDKTCKVCGKTCGVAKRGAIVFNDVPICENCMQDIAAVFHDNHNYRRILMQIGINCRAQAKEAYNKKYYVVLATRAKQFEDKVENFMTSSKYVQVIEGVTCIGNTINMIKTFQTYNLAKEFLASVAPKYPDFKFSIKRKNNEYFDFIKLIKRVER